MILQVFTSIFFFFNDTATTEIYTLSLTTLFRSGDAVVPPDPDRVRPHVGVAPAQGEEPLLPAPERSEEHTSELQSRQYLVCRLLLEKKNKPTIFVIAITTQKSRTNLPYSTTLLI